MKKRFPTEAILPFLLVSTCVAFGAIVAFRGLFLNPEVQLLSDNRRVPLRDTHNASAKYVAHRKTFGNYDTYIKKSNKDEPILPQKET